MWTPDGRLTVWCSSQGHFGIRDNTARILGVPVSNIKVVPMEVGGGFGGKLPVYLEPIAAVLSRKSGRAVKITMDRTEELEATGPTSGSFVRVKMGATREGRITAAHAYFAFEAGGFPGSPLAGASAAVFAPYGIDNVGIDGYDVVDNKPKTTAYRTPGAPIVAFAVESVIDEILQMDPMEFRLLNAAHEGTRRADGVLDARIVAPGRRWRPSGPMDTTALSERESTWGGVWAWVSVATTLEWRVPWSTCSRMAPSA